MTLSDWLEKAGDDILIRVEGRVGHVTLNRPKALNALTYDMAMALEAALLAWRDDDAVAMVLIDAAGEKAFCAGGDVRQIYDSGRAGDFEYGRRFWADEYRMNALIANYDKPYVALMDGIVMGGGVGVSAHGSHRIVTDRTMLAMPECGIGLIPDVGGSYILSRSPGRIGEYAALTGARLSGADAIVAGLADHFVPADRLGDLTAAILDTGRPEIIDDFSVAPPDSPLAEARDKIDAAFAANDLVAILKHLEAAGDEWSGKTLSLIRKGCPISAACAFAILRQARELPRIEDGLALEYRFVSRCMEHGDFLEGVRAAIVDKDRQPKWSHAAIEDVTDEEVGFMLSPAPGSDLEI